MEKMRLNKFVAHCGICSRRKAAELVKAGHIKVNGQVEKNPAVEITANDEVVYKGQIIRPEERKRYVLMNKPHGVITTLSDEQGRKTVMDVLKNKYNERIYPVGRLDRNTTGLLLLTNDGDLAKKLSHPSHKVMKVYQVKLDRDLAEADLEKIKTGINLEDGPVSVDKVSYIQGGTKSDIGIEIHIGRNRIVRRIFEALDYSILKLDRMYYAGLTKKDLPRGFSRDLNEKEIIMLKHFT